MLAEISLTIYFEDKAPEVIAIKGNNKFSQIYEILSKREVLQYEIFADNMDITYDYLEWYCENSEWLQCHA